MATIKGVNQTLVDAGGLSSQMAAGLKDGRVKVATDTVADLAATQTTATDVLKLFGKLPKGAKILFFLFHQDGTQTATISVGDTETADRYHAAGATDINTAEAVMIVPGKHYAIGTIALDDQIILTFAGAVGATGKLYAEVYYTTD